MHTQNKKQNRKTKTNILIDFIVVRKTKKK